MPRAAKETIFDIGDVTCNLGHPPIVGVGCDAGDVDRSGGDVDEEQDVIRDQPLDRVHLDAHEIGRCQAFPVGLEKRRPSSVPVSLGGRLDAVLSEDVGDGASTSEFLRTTGLKTHKDSHCNDALRDRYGSQKSCDVQSLFLQHPVSQQVAQHQKS